MKKQLKIILFLIFFLTVPQMAEATLVNSTDGLFYDTETQLTWYSPTIYDGMSWLDVYESLPSDQRIAEIDEVWDVINKYVALIGAGNPTGLYDSPALDWGETVAGGPDDPYDPWSDDLVDVVFNAYWLLYPSDFVLEHATGCTDWKLSGVWTVKDGPLNAVPAPSALLLLGTGLLGLIKFRKKSAPKE